ncbi:MAG: glycerate kinase [Actinomycetota bacterium]|nr:glycerate kinase [Actinomycetota bacterium]
MRILLAPDKFKGTLDAPAVAAAMAGGVDDAVPGAEARMHPLADGGEGTLDCVFASARGEITPVVAEDAFGERTACRALDHGDRVMIAMHETARLAARPRPSSALRASSRGTGLALLEVLERFPDREVVVFVGGSASTDGGAGAAQAAGWRLLDAAGRDLPPGGGALRALHGIEPPPRPLPTVVVAACDVDAPLLGPSGAAAVFAPQKGAGAAEARVLEEGLAVLAERIRADMGVEVAALPGAGAGGGMGAGLVAFFGARILGGFDLVSAVTGLPGDVEWADVVVTGEGRVDEGTLGGKVVTRVASAASGMDKRCGIVAGEVRLRAEHLPAHETLGVDAVEELVVTCGRARAFADPAGCVRAATTALITRLAAGG